MMALSWPYNQTQEEIQARIAARMGDTVSVQEGTFGDLISRAAAYEIWRFYEQMRKMLPIAFVDETSGEYLVERCREYGIERKAAGSAEVLLTFTGQANTAIPAGTAAVTASGLEFDTLEDVEIRAEGTAEVAARAAQPGAAYNVEAGRVNRLLTAMQGVAAVSNLDAATGGYDAETDAALYARLSAFRCEPATSGNIHQYEQWALEVDGVGAARAIDLWNGPGTVKVVLAGNGLEPVDETVRAAAAAYIESKRPAGPAVTAESAEAVVINIAVAVELDVSATVQSVQAALRSALTDYLHGLAFRSSTVVLQRVAYLLMGIDGVIDHDPPTMNGGTVNVPLTETQVPVLGTVEVTARA